MGIAKVDNSRNHPLYIAYFEAHRDYRAAFEAHQLEEYDDDLATAIGYGKVLELQLASNKAYVAILESGVQPIERY